MHRKCLRQDTPCRSETAPEPLCPAPAPTSPQGRRHQNPERKGMAQGIGPRRSRPTPRPLARSKAAVGRPPPLKPLGVGTASTAPSATGARRPPAQQLRR